MADEPRLHRHLRQASEHMRAHRDQADTVRQLAENYLADQQADQTPTVEVPPSAATETQSTTASS